MTPTPRNKRAHPRSRGEHKTRASPPALPRGSSPLTRGAPRRRRLDRQYPGLIPAHAGSTWWPGLGSRPDRAHPRSRGEHNSMLAYHLPLQGSSPLTRGARNKTIARYVVAGLIPAHAGSTCDCGSHAGAAWAHPRSRGEHGGKCGRGRCRVGSSPLTRGALLPPLVVDQSVRLIPAHAGSTRRFTSSWSALGAHPRSRGEHFLLTASLARKVGSSPLTRGAPIPGRWNRNRYGLIPAHAGSTDAVFRHRGGVRAHPRSRGEHSAIWPHAARPSGSSPLTRGALGYR